MYAAHVQAHRALRQFAQPASRPRNRVLYLLFDSNGISQSLLQLCDGAVLRLAVLSRLHQQPVQVLGLLH